MIGWMFPALLGALAAISIPVIMHFIKRRPTVVVVPTLQFIPKGFRAYRRRLKLHEYLLLLLRILLVALLVAACAHPFFRAPLHAPDWDSENTVFLVDASLSMQGMNEKDSPVWQEVIENIEDRIDDLPKKQNWCIFLYADDVFQTVNASNNWKSILKKWKTERPTCGGTDYNKAWEYVKLFLTDTDGSSHIIWYTDLQEDALAEMHTHSLPASCNVEVVPYSPQKDSAAIYFTRPVYSTRVDETNSCSFQLEGFEDTDDIAFFLDDIRIKTDVRSLAGDNAKTFSVTIPPLKQGVHTLRAAISVDDDSYSVNNKDTALVYAHVPWRVGIISSSPVRDTYASKTVYLTTAITSLVQESSWHVTPEIIQPDSLPQRDVNQYRVMIIADDSTLQNDTVDFLEKFVENGGGLLTFCGSHVDIDWYNSHLAEKELLPARLEYPTARAVNNSYTRITISDWDADHPALKWCGDEYGAYLKNIHFYRVMRTIPAKNARVLMTFENDDATLIAGTKGKGKVALFTSSANREWSAFPRSRLFVPFMRELLQWLAQQPDVDDMVETKIIAVTSLPESTARPGIVIEKETPFSAKKYVLQNTELSGKQGRPAAVQAALGVQNNSFKVYSSAQYKGIDDSLLSWLILLVFIIAAAEGIYANSVSYV